MSIGIPIPLSTHFPANSGLLSLPKATMLTANGSCRSMSTSGLCRPLAAQARAVRCCRAPMVTCQAFLETKNVGAATNIRYHASSVEREEKEMLLGQRGCIIWFTGKSLHVLP